VEVVGGCQPLVSVRSVRELPKAALLPAMDVLAQVRLRAPVVLGQRVVENILDTGVDIVATWEVAAVSQPGKAVGKRVCDDWE